MAWEVRWAQAAFDDLDSVAGHIGKDSPNYAATFVRDVLEAGCSLAQMAERGRVVPEWHEDSIRELLLGNYRLIYHVTEQVVYVIGLVHGARDLDALWKREGRQPSRN